MSETTAQYLLRLHSTIGITADAATIDRRSASIDALAANITVEQTIAAAAVSTGLVADLAKVRELLQPVSDSDPGFAPVQVDKAAAVVCSAVTNKLLAGGGTRGLTAALVVLCASMGQATQHVDERLRAIAQQQLWAIQRTAAPEAKYIAPQPQVTAEQIKALIDTLAAGNVANTTAPMQVVADGILAALAAQSAAVGKAFEALSVRQAIVEDETRMQWWVVGKASAELFRPFAALPPFEAAARAASDLSAMVSRMRPAGPFAAPALLERVLHADDPARSNAKPFAEAIVGIPLAERPAILKNKPSTTNVPGAFPIMLAAEYSIESGDEEDWQPRFKRAAHVDVHTKITPVEFAEQLYREFLLWKLLQK
ncbi:GTPase-associated system all-helical protein GASH [Paraburkholderia caribensis]|uniref:GTPase-associated system helical domain-containing protein n=2 Tax=Paraburkholderia TaxID=1822464 RepID=B2JXC4_PARP8|nr:MULTISPECIES: GTPase-associated system all-helical protein GASH [Paraburkholderia]ACC76282.1 hypothetical protein Bphy_7295 [Paraburkholderia phymatum STM815]MCO4882349.1 hypothetical protein [Paraburkholderia caribensis]PTB24310.1 hypothetical protein C9I56_34530 [Paraburkholderia caribensis]